jgi:hypothetical protein
MFCRRASCSSVAVGFVFLRGMKGKKDAENQKGRLKSGFRRPF